MPVYQHLDKPAEIKAAKAKMPVAYLPLGILEWHGLHNPAGLDGVKAEGVASFLADKFGGVVQPSLFWGDHRAEICELVFEPSQVTAATFDHTLPICEGIGYDKQALVDNARRSGKNGGWRLWEELLVHVLFELESFGYKCVVAIPGHYPLFGPLDRAIAAYQAQDGTCDVYPLKDTMYDDTGTSGDHAAKFETSLMLALRPELVDLSRLSPDLTQPNIGVLGEDPRTEASADFGRKILDKFAALVEARMKNHY